MPAHFKQKKEDILAGVIGLRAPDGSIMKTIPFYKPSPDVVKKSRQLTEGEKEVCEGIVATMANLFGEYVRSVQAMERKNKQHGEIKNDG